jgi:hypothetical protein
MTSCYFNQKTHDFVQHACYAGVSFDNSYRLSLQLTRGSLIALLSLLPLCSYEQPIKGIVSPAAMARMTVAEALTNLMWARVSSIDDIKARYALLFIHTATGIV